MNETITNSKSAPRWLTYGAATAFLAPTVGTLGFACIFLFPKLRQIWQEAAFADATFRGLLNASILITRNGIWILLASVMVLILLEWRSASWPRYRRTMVGVMVWLLNVAVLVVMTAMLISLLIVVPSFIPAR